MAAAAGRRHRVDLRLHGADALYSGTYADAALDRWADRIR
jgi:hypothetical protein|uniref:Uncharacterized protein n=1 Tax=Ralstonia pickettii (strain 12D) TaxID=428406 RepID=C6BME5_RALP1